MRAFSTVVCVARKILVASVLGISLSAIAQTDVLTWHNDNFRTGQNRNEVILTRAKVNPANFGLLFQVPMDGKVDAQPLYVSALSMPGKGSHNVVFAATERDTVYAFDADTRTILWRVSLLGKGETTSDVRNCNQVTPEIGITATPAISRRSATDGSIYVVAMSKDPSQKYHQRIHALDLGTGAEQFGGPIEVHATYPGTGDNSSNGKVIFDPKQYKDRPGLLVLNGNVYTSWGSHCDIRPYTGWLIAYGLTTLKQTSVLNFAPNGSDAGLWNAGAGPAADSNGNIYIALANGTFDTRLTPQGFPSQGDFGNAMVKVSLNGALKVTDYWGMFNANAESSTDTDLGSGGAMLLPAQTDVNGAIRHLAVAAGKDTNLYVVDRDNMGKFDASSNSTIYQQLSAALPNEMFSSPVYFNGHVYYGAVSSTIRAFLVDKARMVGSPTSMTSHSFQYPGTTPSISSNKSTEGILWAVDNSTPAVLYAYDASNLAKELYNSSQAAAARDQFGAGNKFMVPTIANGKVFVGTPNGVAAFGILQRTHPVIPDGDYNLTNQSSRLLLDDPAESMKSGIQLVQATNNGGAGQKWFFSSQGNGYYLIQNVASGLFLTDPGGAKTSGTPLQQQNPASNDSQLWSLRAPGPGYVLLNKAAGLVVDDPSGDRNPGTGIILSTVSNKAEQVWTISPAR